MQADEARGLAALAGVAVAGGSRRIAELHAAIADRVFRGVRRGLGPAADPVRLVHDGIAGAAYAAVRTGLTGGSRVAGVLAARWAGTAAVAAAAAGPGAVATAGPAAAGPAGAGTAAEPSAGGAVRGAVGAGGAGERFADHPVGRHVLAVLNGAHGDMIERDLAALALPMTLRHRGRDLAPEPAALAAAYPQATARLAVFLPGLGETEAAWRYQATRRHGDPEHTYGAALERELGYSPVWLRYNTGLRVSDNGRRLAGLLERLVAGWPVPVAEIVLIGHSMGGLVARSALAQAVASGELRWPTLVRETITLGSPHLGAPLEQGVNVLTHLLGRLGETRPLATVLAARSAGIKDLRYGNLLDADWDGHDPDALLRNTRTPVPLHAGARHFVVLATVVGSADSLAGDLVGDLLVRPGSAAGHHSGPHRLPLPDAHIHRLPGLHHLDLLNHPAVYRQLHRWLADRPDGEAGPAGPAG